MSLEPFEPGDVTAAAASSAIVGVTLSELGRAEVVVVLRSTEGVFPHLAYNINAATARQFAASLLNHADDVDERNGDG